jgi:hypothetical protein
MFRHVLAAYTILSFDRAHILVLELRGYCNESRGANLHEDEVRREANRAFNENSGTKKEKGSEGVGGWGIYPY